MPSASRRFISHVVLARLLAPLLLLVPLLLVACGGGGGSSSTQVGPSSNDGVLRIEPYERTAGLSLQLRSAPVAAEPTAPTVVPSRVVLAPLGPAPQDLAPRAAGQPVRIGEARDIAATASAAATGGWLSWQAQAGGGQAAAVTFRSEGAAGLRLGLQVERLPAQAVLRVFGSGGSTARLSAAEVLASLARDAQAANPGAAPPLFWTPVSVGEEATLQIELPAGTASGEVALALPELSHLWWTHAAVRSAAELVTPRAVGACEIDASCETAYSYEARSVARMEYVDSSDHQSYYCTGTLLANTSGTGTPNFLTANHCVGNQASASTVLTYWFYRAASCGSSTLDPAATQVTGGATLRYAASDSDVSLMELANRPPVGVVYAGSLVGQPALHVTVGALHHPGGDWLKYSEGTISAYGSCAGTLCRADNDASGNYLVLQWSRGATELGSSGSAVFATVNSKHYLVGHLFAGTSSCTNTTGNDYYGRFDRAYPSLKTWLGTVPGS